MKERLVVAIPRLALVVALAALAWGFAIVFAVDEPLVVPDVRLTATAARVDEACLTAAVPLVDAGGNFVRTHVFTVCATSAGLTGPERLKLRDALVVMARSKGLIP